MAEVRKNDLVTLAAVVLCFFLSGLAALLYQVAWLREFSIVFGTSELAVAAVLAAYMGGLGLGAALAARFLSQNSRPILTYAVLEGGIALSALLVPALVGGVSTLYVLLLGGQPAPPESSSFGQPVFYLFVAFVILAIPTGFMGATLPLLTRYAVNSDRNIAPRVGLLYGVNTLGAVAGALLTGFVLLPRLGLRNTIYLGVAINALVFAIAALLSRRKQLDIEDTISRQGKPFSRTSLDDGFMATCIRPLWQTGFLWRGQSAWILPVIALSGFNAFTYEVLWTRLLSHAVGGSIYAFTTMLAVFLAGIAIGGGFIGYVTRDRSRAIWLFILCQLLIALSSSIIFARMGMWMPETRDFNSLARFAALVMFPATLFIGATFPLAVRILSPDKQAASRSTARVYAWNTVGAIGGAIAAGFLVIPTWGFDGTIRFAVLLNLFLAAWVAITLGSAARLAVPATLALLAAGIVLYSPARPEALINRSLFFVSDNQNTSELYFGVGRSSTVLLHDKASYFELRTNGLPEATIPARGASPFTHTQRWLGGLPVIARPSSKNMLVVGFGGGVALEGIPPSIQDVDVIELEPEILAANAILSAQRSSDPLTDGRIRTIFNDARNGLALTHKSYDIIVSQPSHPWTAGASHLFTREFMSLAHEHLNAGGVFLQWMNAEFIDEYLLRGLAATLLEEFPHVRLYHPSPGVLLFLASDTPLDVEYDILQSGLPFSNDADHYRTMGINGIHDVVAALALDEAGVRQLAVDGQVITDNRNIMATRSRSFADGLGADQLLNIFRDFDPLLTGDGLLYKQVMPDINISSLGTRMLYEGFYRRNAMLAQTLMDIPSYEADAHLLRAIDQRSSGATARMRSELEQVLARDAENQSALFLLAEDQQQSIAGNTASNETRQLLSRLSEPVLAVTTAWRLHEQGDWSALRQIDTQLAAAEPSDLWYSQAVRMRTAWRLEMAETSPSESEMLATAALRLIDTVTSLNSDIDLYLLRARAAQLLDDRDTFIDSSWSVVNEIWRLWNDAWEGYTNLAVADYASMYQAAAQLQAGLKDTTMQNAARDENALNNSLDEIMQELSQYSDD